MMQNAVLARDDEVHIGGIGLVDVRQRVKVPPAVVFVRVIPKVIPRVIRRLLGLVRPERAVLRAPVEVDAVAARVTEHAVEDDANAARTRFLYERAKILDVAEHGVDLMIVPRIVMMVALGLKDGVKVDARDAKIGEVVELADDPLEVSAEKVVGDDLLRIRVFEIHGIVRPVRPNDRAFLADDLVPRAREPIREDLIHDGVLEPIGRVRALVVDRHLIRSGRGAAERADAAEHLFVVAVEIGAAFRRDDEIVP